MHSAQEQSAADVVCQFLAAQKVVKVRSLAWKALIASCMSLITHPVPEAGGTIIFGNQGTNNQKQAQTLYPAYHTIA